MVEKVKVFWYSQFTYYHSRERITKSFKPIVVTINKKEKKIK